MEEFFNNLKKEGKNDVDSLLKWIKDSNLIGPAKDAEDKVRALFKDCKDQKNVDFAKFKEIVEKLAAEQKKNLDEVKKTLAQQGPRVLEQLKKAMEDFFNDLKKEGKNDVDSLLKWIKDSNLIGPAKDAEDKVRALFKDSKDLKNVDFAKFKEVVEKLAAEQKKNLEEVKKTMAQKGPRVLEQLTKAMEDFFNDFKKEGKNDVDSLLKWIKDSNLIGPAKDAEDKVRALFKDSKDLKNVDFAKFKEVVEKLAAEQKKNFEEVKKTLAQQGPRVLEQLKKGTSTAAETAADAASKAAGK